MNLNKDLFYVEFGLINRLITFLCLEMTNTLKKKFSFDSDIVMQIILYIDQL